MFSCGSGHEVCWVKSDSCPITISLHKPPSPPTNTLCLVVRSHHMSARESVLARITVDQTRRIIDQRKSEDHARCFENFLVLSDSYVFFRKEGGVTERRKEPFYFFISLLWHLRFLLFVLYGETFLFFFCIFIPEYMWVWPYFHTQSVKSQSSAILPLCMSIS